MAMGRWMKSMSLVAFVRVAKDPGVPCSYRIVFLEGRPNSPELYNYPAVLICPPFSPVTYGSTKVSTFASDMTKPVWTSLSIALHRAFPHNERAARLPLPAIKTVGSPLNVFSERGRNEGKTLVARSWYIPRELAGYSYMRWWSAIKAGQSIW